MKELASRRMSIIVSSSVFIVEKQWSSRREAVSDYISPSLFYNMKRVISPYLPSRDREAVSMFFY